MRYKNDYLSDFDLETMGFDGCEMYERLSIEPIDNRIKKITIKAKTLKKAQKKAKKKLLLLENEVLNQKIISEEPKRPIIVQFWISKI